jgi:hypothetical protein
MPGGRDLGMPGGRDLGMPGAALGMGTVPRRDLGPICVPGTAIMEWWDNLHRYFPYGQS